MNGTWLAFFTLIMVVLIAVAVGAQQMEAQNTLEMAQMMEQRDTAVKVAQEAVEQRNVAFKVRDEAVAKVDGLNAELANLKGDKEKAQLDLQNAQSAAESREKEVARLENEANALQAQMKDLQDKNVVLEQKVLGITVTGSENTAAVNTGNAENNAICLPVQAGDLQNQLGLGLAILIGMAALGSGGFIYYRQDPNRKYAVKMTKEQIRDYARYQRERGNRAV